MTPVGLRCVTRDTDFVCWRFNDRFPHLLFDLSFFIWSAGQQKALGSVKVFCAWAVARFTTDHQEILVRIGYIATRIAKTGDVALKARSISAVVFWKVRKRLSMISLRPGVSLWTMANETLIGSHKRLLDARRHSGLICRSGLRHTIRSRTRSR
jgi:hypothetical protein